MEPEPQIAKDITLNEYRHIPPMGNDPQSVGNLSMAGLIERAVRNARPRVGVSARWHCVAEAFGLGSTYAWQLCEVFGLNPDEELGEAEEDEEDEDE